MEEISQQQLQHEKTYKVGGYLSYLCSPNHSFDLMAQDMHAAKSKHPGSVPHGLNQLPQKASPLEALGLGTRPGIQKTTMFESRTCKELMGEKVNRVS